VSIDDGQGYWRTQPVRLLPIRDFRIIVAFRAIVLSPNRMQKMTDDTSPVNQAWRFLEPARWLRLSSREIPRG
jgi:hypothetical protein